MIAAIQVTPSHWAIFILGILFFLALDLGLFHRRARVVKFKEALAWSAVWIALSLLFAVALNHWRGREEAVEFVTGYVIEFSLSLDNIFVIALLFAYFRVPEEGRHRLLFWGILGALVSRGAMIALGVTLIQSFNWILYVLGVFLVFTGGRMLFTGNAKAQPEQNFTIRLARRFFPVAINADGQNHAALQSGIERFAPAPLLLVLALVEITDLIFALDSIPAVFAVTTKPFIVFTSNVFAILGLRSLYFVLVDAINYFRHLKTGLSVVLVFVGAKMLLDPHGHEPKWFQIEIPTSVSLLIVAGIFLISIALSVTAAQREKTITDKHG
ncbi:MAG: TerC/Alx family metal homeostasis membrane protein [Verrucomicrobiota bacterium]|jgi:tellurite resistance protein TerC